LRLQKLYHIHLGTASDIHWAMVNMNWDFHRLGNTGAAEELTLEATHCTARGEA